MKKIIIIAVLLILTIISVLLYICFGFNVLDFFTTQILGMKWLDDLVYNLLSLFPNDFVDSLLGSSIQFFIYDVIKISVLLCFLIFGISYIQSYFPPERTKIMLSKYNGVTANIFGALLGTVTPFCSCSSIPLFIGFTRAKLSSGITFSFLISSPLVDLGSLILLASIFGWPIAVLYVVVGLILAIIGGTIIDKTKIGEQVQEYVLEGDSVDIEQEELTKSQRVSYAINQVTTTFKKVIAYILIGVLIGAFIHNRYLDTFIEMFLGNDKWYSVILATFSGVPMYADIFGTIPIAEALYARGIGLGTILSFMMSVTALSLPSMIMLSKVVKKKLLFTYIGIVTFGIVVIGYVFNIIGNYL